MPLFDETPVAIAYPIVTVTTYIARTRLGKWHFLRRIMLLQRYPVVMVTTRFEHTRSRKCHLLRKLLLQYLTKLLKLLHVLNILGQENATFWGDSCYYSLTLLYWLLHVLNILGPGNATFWGEDTWLKNFFLMVTTCSAHIRSGKCHFLRTLRLL